MKTLLRRTKIVATVGPASRDESTLRAMLQAGVDVVRLNFSHGSHEEHAEVIRRVRQLAHRLGKPVAILQDLQGPKIRLGALAKEPLHLAPGDEVAFRFQPASDDPQVLPIDFPDLAQFVRPGRRILLDDGNLEFEVLAVEGNTVRARTVLGGEVTSHKGVNLPGTKLDIPGFTEKDEEDLTFGLHHGVDAVAISFVRSEKDVTRVRQAIAEVAPERVETPLIAKLERPEALENLHQIIHAADGVMVARGDLGVEMSPESVPIAQKRIIEMANRHAKLVITATQMLDSMIHNPRPTRAEASDVANAIFDGSDAVMLSGETAIGKYPVQAVRMMDAIVRTAEANLDRWGHWRGVPGDETRHDDALSLAIAARELAHDREVAGVAVFTQTGRTAVLMAKTRPRVPVLAFTPEERTYRRLAMHWGIIPYRVPFADTVERMLRHVETGLRTATHIESGEQVVIVAGFPVGAMRPPNFLLLHTVGQIP